jgi:hypothetical protein
MKLMTSNETFDTTLESAIQNLSAIEVAPGRYAFQLPGAP